MWAIQEDFKEYVMNLKDMLDVLVVEDDPNKCKDRFFRVRKNAYIHNGKIVISTTLKELKRKSCPGCNVCGWMEDDLYEGLVNYGESYIDGLDELKDGDMVRLNVVIDSTDYETGHADSWHLKAYKVDEI